MRVDLEGNPVEAKPTVIEVADYIELKLEEDFAGISVYDGDEYVTLDRQLLENFSKAFALALKLGWLEETKLEVVGEDND